MASIFETKEVFSLFCYFCRKGAPLTINYSIYCRLKFTEPIKKWIFRRKNYVSRKSAVLLNNITRILLKTIFSWSFELQYFFFWVKIIKNLCLSTPGLWYLFSGAGQDNIRYVGLGTWYFLTFWALEPGVLH